MQLYLIRTRNGQLSHYLCW